jgi:hypothetical protein
MMLSGTLVRSRRDLAGLTLANTDNLAYQEDLLFFRAEATSLEYKHVVFR